MGPRRVRPAHEMADQPVPRSRVQRRGRYYARPRDGGLAGWRQPRRTRLRPTGESVTTLSTHVLDVERGAPAAGVPIALFAGDRQVAEGVTDPGGRIADLARGPTAT